MKEIRCSNESTNREFLDLNRDLNVGLKGKKNP